MKKVLNLFISLFLFLLVLGVAVHKGPKLWNDLQNIHLNWAVAGLGVYFLNYLLRAGRLRVISGQRIEFWPDAIHSASFHGVATYFLPIRTGDLTLPLILKSVSNIELVEGGRILLKARLLDLTTLGFLMIAAALCTTVSISPLVRVVWLASALGISALPFAIKWMNLRKWHERLRLLRFVGIFETVTTFSYREIQISLGIWMAVALCFYCAAKAVNLDVGLGDVVFIITIQLPLQLLPVQGFANAGNHEGGWIAGLALIGVSASESVTFALTSHALLIVYVLALGILALVTRKASNTNPPHAS